MKKCFVVRYSTFKYVAGEGTLFKNIYSLLPGHYLVYDKNNLIIQKYWDIEEIDPGNDTPKTMNSMIKNYDKLMHQSINRRLMSDVPLGTFNSGGLDSSLVTAITSGEIDATVNSFSIGFEETEYDESDYAQTVSEKYHTNHHLCMVNNKLFSDNLEKCIWLHDEPLNHANSVTIFLLSKFAKESVTVVLTGEGADSFYCGYYIFDLIKYLYINNPLRPITHLLAKLLPVCLFPKRYQDKLTKIKSVLTFPPDEYIIFNDIFAFVKKERVSSLLNIDCPHSFAANYTSLFKHYSKENIMEVILYIYQTLFIIEALNTMAKLGNCYHIEHRYPFINTDMINLFNQFPWREKNKFFKRKHQIVELGKKYVPEEFFKMPKEGFGVPLQVWFYDEKGLGRFMGLLSDRKTRERGFYNSKYLDLLLKKYSMKHLAEDSFEGIIWTIVNYELWYRIYIERDIKGYS